MGASISTLAAWYHSNNRLHWAATRKLAGWSAGGGMGMRNLARAHLRGRLEWQSQHGRAISVHPGQFGLVV